MINSPTEVRKIIQDALTDYKKKIRELSERKKTIINQAVQNLQNKKRKLK